MATQQRRHRYLMSGLLEAWDWFDNGLQNVLRSRGLRSLNKSQSMMVLYISAGVSRPIEIAKKMRLSRQAIRHIANQLIRVGLVEAHADPRDRRSKVLVLSRKAAEIRNVAAETIFALEHVLERRIGAKRVAMVRDALERDWGAPIAGRMDLEALEAAPKRKRTTSRRAAPARAAALRR